MIRKSLKLPPSVRLVELIQAMAKGNDILECSFLDQRLNRIIILVAAALILMSIVVIGVVNNMGLENARGIGNVSDTP